MRKARLSRHTAGLRARPLCLLLLLGRGSGYCVGAPGRLLPGVASAHYLSRGAPAALAVGSPREAPAAAEAVGAAAASAASAEDAAEESERDLEWEVLASNERFSRLADISRSIGQRRTVEEAEFALRLEEDFNADPSILRDIDFGAILSRLRADLGEDACHAAVLTPDELQALRGRQRSAETALADVAPRYNASAGAVAQSVPKLRRVIAKARELPLAVEPPRPGAAEGEGEGFDLRAAVGEAQSLAVAARNVWERLNGGNFSREDELRSLQRESKALLSLRAEASKLRAGIRLVQRQKELKRKALVRYNAEALLEETLRADESIMKLQKELGLKAALLELERIYVVVEAELRSKSTLTDQLLPMVERYGALEGSVRGMVALVRSERHESVDDEQLDAVEKDIGEMLLQLGLQGQDDEYLAGRGALETAQVSMSKVLQGVAFYTRGLQLMGQDVQLFGSMLARATLQGYTLRPQETKILRRIAKDLVTVVPAVVILLIPLTPLGHVLVFSFIQRFFPDFYPSQFTEERQNLMTMYSSLTERRELPESGGGGADGAAAGAAAEEAADSP